MNIIEDIVSWGHGELYPSYVVIHETANPGATARNHRDYWASNDTYAVHYCGDWFGDVYHCVPDDRICWQVGNGNPYVVGIELCHATNQEDFEAVWRVGIEWSAMMLNRYGWGIDRLISHNDCTNWWGGSDHTDPISYFENHGKSWEQFKQEVADYMASGGFEEEAMYDVNVPAVGTPVHRLFNAGSGEHFYTCAEDEKDGLVSQGWAYEGVAWKCPDPQVAVFRMWMPGGKHFFTASFDEAQGLTENRWKCEGVPFFAKREGAPVRRAFNKYTGDHLLTTSDADMANAIAAGYADEGVAFHV